MSATRRAAKDRVKEAGIFELPEGTTSETIAEAVRSISDGVKKLRAGQLNDKAILLLISHSSGVPQRTVKAVIDGMESLKDAYLK